MAYKIKYKTKKGGGMVVTLPTIQMVNDKLLRLFKAKTRAVVESDNIVIGECYKLDGRWYWYLDIEA